LIKETLRVAEPRELTTEELKVAEALVRRAFSGHFRSHDWLHAVDGVHVVLTDNDELVGFAAVVPRTLRHGDQLFDTGYVEAVAVDPTRQGAGLGRIVMDQAEAVIRERHHIGALNAVSTAAEFYATRGWWRWTGHTQAMGPNGTVDTYDEADLIYLFDPAGTYSLDRGMPLVCDWRAGDLW